MDDSSPKEATKRWGFRRSTIARREFIEEIGNLDLVTLTPRRTARQPKGKARGRGRGKQPPENPPKSARGGRGAIPLKVPDLKPGAVITASRRLQKASFETADQAEDSDELTLRELQERARKRRKSEEIQQESNPETATKDGDSRNNAQTDPDVSSLAVRPGITEIQKSAPRSERQENEEPEEPNKAAGSASSDEEYSDPDAVYCICQQKHNNRFMIRCDRCHEWFHGDCVGISQARGCLLEKNGEDYVCPSCTPCQSPIGLPKAPSPPPPPPPPQHLVLSKALSSSSESLLTSSAGEEKPSEDEGVKGKIRKSSSRGTKTRIKIFRPVETLEATSEPEERAVAGEQGATEETGKDQEHPVEKDMEKAAVPQCIGPGCNNDALPESVYCGHQCIIRHAAVAMHTEPEAHPEIKIKPAVKPTLKIQNLGKLFKKKASEKPGEGEDGRSKETGSAPAAPLPPDPVHKAVGEQQPAAIASSLFYKATPTKPESDAEEPNKTPVATQPESPKSSAPSEAPAADQKAAEKPPSSSLPVRRPASNPLPSRAKKTMPGSPRLSAPRHEAPQANKIAVTAPNEPPQTQDSSTKPHISNPNPEVRVLPVTPAPVAPPRPLQAHPNMQMRQNIRRSLTDALLKRVNTSDDLEIPESEVERLAVNIEREMFNMFYTTDNKYKTKYMSLLLSLKDPKNKALFYQVVKGHITPFKLTHLSDQELLSVQGSSADPVAQKEQSCPDGPDLEQPLSATALKSDIVTPSSSEGKIPLSPAKPKPSTAVSAIISTMLKDTTVEHKAHLFDLKCRICTGQISEDTDTTTAKKEDPKEKPPADTPPGPAPGHDSPVMESPASPSAEECSEVTPQEEFSPPVIPAVSIVTITRRDPRTAGYRAPTSAPVPPPAPAPDPPKTCAEETTKEPKAVETPIPAPAPPPAPPPFIPKSILMKPSAPSVPMFYSSQGLSTRLTTSHAPADNKTTHFLSRQDTMWKGFLNMQLVAKFVTKGCMISGSAEVLKKDLPDTVHIGGRILPDIVWEYVERVKTSLTKELCLIRFYPASDEEEVAYVSLFSYFNSRRRFGVVSNIANNIKDLYLIPLCANKPIPSVLLPLEGPGLEEDHPNLLIGLAVCQKLKRPGAQTHDLDEKRPKIQDPQTINLPPKSKFPDSDREDPDIAVDATPAESPSNSSPSSLNPPSVLSNVRQTSALAAVSKIPSSSSAPKNSGAPSASTTPLQTILDTIFGKKKQDFANTSQATTPTPTPTPTVKEPGIPFLTVDPIVQQYQQTAKAAVEGDGTDRPYDPEEEYDPALGYRNLSPVKPQEISKPKTDVSSSNNNNGGGGDDDRPYDPEEEYNLGNRNVSVHATKHSDAQPSLGTCAAKDDVAYDPEDDSVFEEMQNFLTDNKPAKSEYGTSAAASMSLSDQQKMLEDLNRQIEEQKRQLEEQEEALRLQRAAVGVSMAHFSVSEALMSPPPRFGREPDDDTEKTPSAINLNRDPRQYRNFTPNTVNPTLTDQTGNENSKRKSPSQDSGKSDNKTPSGDDSVRNSGKSAPPGLSELPESSTTSSSGNRRSKSPSKESKQSHASRRQHRSPSQRRSRHETRRTHHEKRTSDQSKDAGHRRRTRRSPERSSKRSRSRSRRNERPSSREREQHRQRSTSSRHGSRRDRRHSSPKARSARSRACPEPDHSSVKEKSESRQKDEPGVELRDSSNSEQPPIPSEKSPNDASESGEPKITITQQAESDESRLREQASSEEPRSSSSQRKQVKVEPNQVQNEEAFQANPLQREEFHKSKPQFGKFPGEQGRNSEPFHPRHQHSQRGSVLNNNEETKDMPSTRPEFDHLPQKVPKIERDFPEPVKDLPMRPPHFCEDREMTPLQKQNLGPRGLTPEEGLFMASDDLPQFENDIHRNIHPRDPFRPRAIEGQWRDPVMGGLRGHASMPPRIPRVPLPEQFERPAGPRGPSPRMFDDCGPSPDFGPSVGPSPVPRMLDDFGNRNRRTRGPSPVSRMLEGASVRLSEPKGRFRRPVMLEGPGPQTFGPRDAFSRPEMFDGPVTESPQFDDSWECDGPRQHDRETFSEFRRLRGRGPPQRFHESTHDIRDSEQLHFNDSRCYADPAYDDAEKEPEPLQYLDDPRDYDPIFANEVNMNPQARGHRYPAPCPMPTRIPAHTRISAPNPPEGPRVSRMKLNVRRSHHFDELRDQAIERETVKPHFTKPDIFEGDRDCERAAPVRGPCFNPPPNLRGPRAPSPQFHSQRMLPPHTAELHPDGAGPPRFPLPSKTRPLRLPQVPNASEVQNPTQSRIRLDGPNKEPEILPMRLSGPLLPTPPGGPMNLHSPRMQRPCPYNENNLPQRPAARGRGNPGVKPGRFDNELNNRDGETFQGRFPDGETGDLVDREEDYSNPWCRESSRRSGTVRSGHSSERHNREDIGERGMGRDRVLSRETFKTRY